MRNRWKTGERKTHVLPNQSTISRIQPKFSIICRENTVPSRASLDLLGNHHLDIYQNVFAYPPVGELLGIAMDLAVDGISFYGVAARFDDQLPDLIDGEHFWSGCSSVVVDQLMTHSAVDVVGTIR